MQISKFIDVILKRYPYKTPARIAADHEVPGVEAKLSPAGIAVRTVAIRLVL